MNDSARLSPGRIWGATLYRPYNRATKLVVGALWLGITTVLLARIGGIFFPPLVLLPPFLPLLVALIGVLWALSRRKISRMVFYLFGGMFYFSVIALASAVGNGTGLINWIIDVLLFLGPIVWFAVGTQFVWERKILTWFTKGFLLLGWLHVFLAYFQSFVLHYDNDHVVGLFIGMGAGAHAAGALSAILSLYYLREFSGRQGKDVHRCLLITAALFSAYVVVLADAKQIVVMFFVALSLVIIYTQRYYRNVYYRIKSWLFLLSVIGMGLLLKVTLFPALGVWLKFQRLKTGLLLKLQVFPIIYHSFASWRQFLIGMGPGNTVTKLSFLLDKYRGMLSAFGGTHSALKETIWLIQESHPYTNHITGTSAFSLFFSWAGLWGDLGFLSVMVYGGLWYVIWKAFPQSDWFSKTLILMALMLGFLFSWLEEPQFMMVVVSVLLIHWHRLQVQ